VKKSFARLHLFPINQISEVSSYKKNTFSSLLNTNNETDFLFHFQGELNQKIAFDRQSTDSDFHNALTSIFRINCGRISIRVLRLLIGLIIRIQQLGKNCCCRTEMRQGIMHNGHSMMLVNL